MKHTDIINSLDLEQKCALLSGSTVFTTRALPGKGVPAITLSDGPNGVRKQAGAADHLGLNPSVPATCFPTSATVANSWDPALGEAVGAAMGEEAAAQGVETVKANHQAHADLPPKVPVPEMAEFMVEDSPALLGRIVSGVDQNPRLQQAGHPGASRYRQLPQVRQLADAQLGGDFPSLSPPILVHQPGQPAEMLPISDQTDQIIDAAEESPRGPDQHHSFYNQLV